MLDVFIYKRNAKNMLHSFIRFPFIRRLVLRRASGNSSHAFILSDLFFAPCKVFAFKWDKKDTIEKSTKYIIKGQEVTNRMAHVIQGHASNDAMTNSDFLTISRSVVHNTSDKQLEPWR